MADQEVKLRITTDASTAVAGVNRVGQELQKLETSTGGWASKIRTHWLGVAAAITAVGFTAGKAFSYIADATKVTARIETMGVVLNTVGRNAGYSSGYMHQLTEDVKRLGITTQAAQQGLTQMTQAQIGLTHATKLARISQDAAVIGNINSSEAFEKMIYGIQSGQVDVLRTIGINVNFEQSYQKLAERLGKTTDALTEQEKAQARTNVVLAQGANISGVYAASMNTVGKQALSLARHSETAKERFGELFKPTYAALIGTISSLLEGLNSVMERMQKEGTLQKWGEGISSTLTFFAQNIIPLAIGGLASMAVTAVKVGVQFEALRKIFIGLGSTMKANLFILAATGAAMGGNYLGKKMEDYWEGKKPGGGLTQLMKDQEEEKAYQAERWKKIQKELEASGIKGMLDIRQLATAKSAGDIVEYQVDVGGGKMERRWKDVRNEIQKTKEMMDATTRGFLELSGTVDRIGAGMLKYGEEDMTRRIREQADDVARLTTEYHNLSEASQAAMALDEQIGKVADIKDAFSDFRDIIDDVYTTQLFHQNEILDKMKDYGAKQTDIAKQTINVHETEKKLNEARLANYRTFYDELKKKQSEFFEAAVKAAQRIADIEKTLMGARKQTTDLLAEAWEKANPARDGLEQWNRDMEKMSARIQYAGGLSGKDRIGELQAIQRDSVGMIRQVDSTEVERRLGPNGYVDVEVKKTVKSLGDTYQTVSQIIANCYNLIEDEAHRMAEQDKATQAKALEGYRLMGEEIKNVEMMMAEMRNEIIRIDELLAQKRTLTIDVSGTLSDLRLVLDSINNIGYVSPARSVPPVAGQYASGTPYVPKTGLYQLHKGEAVIPADRNNGSGNVTINMGGVVINGSGNMETAARDLVKAVEREQRKMRALGA